jgi:hypothetical protein
MRMIGHVPLTIRMHLLDHHDERAEPQSASCIGEIDQIVSQIGGRVVQQWRRRAINHQTKTVRVATRSAKTMRTRVQKWEPVYSPE